MKITKEKRLLITPGNIEIDDIVMYKTKYTTIAEYDKKCKDGVYMKLYKVVNIYYEEWNKINSNLYPRVSEMHGYPIQRDDNIKHWFVDCVEYMSYAGQIRKNSKAITRILIDNNTLDKVDKNHLYIQSKINQLQLRIDKLNNL